MSVYNLIKDELVEVYDTLGTSLTKAYDIAGTEIFSGSSPTPIDKYSRILNVPTMDEGWTTNAETQYLAFKSALESAGNNAIPMFISTDPHGGGAMSEHRWFHNHNVADNLEALNINLGDICADTYQPSILSNMNAQTRWVRNFMAVGGNHDVKFGDVEPTAETLRPYFAKANCFECVPTTYDTSACYVAKDNIHNIKFVAMDAYTRVGEGYTMPHPHIATSTMNWLIDVLSANDGYDVVFITHEPFQGATYTAYDLNNAPAVTASGTATYSQSECVWNLLKARKNKRSGTITDDDGVFHAYDFTKCANELIVSLHGHTHALRYTKDDNIASIAFSRFYFVNLIVVDRTNSVLKLFMTTYTGNYNEIDFAI